MQCKDYITGRLLGKLNACQEKCGWYDIRTYATTHDAVCSRNKTGCVWLRFSLAFPNLRCSLGVFNLARSSQKNLSPDNVFSLGRMMRNAHYALFFGGATAASWKKSACTVATMLCVSVLKCLTQRKRTPPPVAAADVRIDVLSTTGWDSWTQIT